MAASNRHLKQSQRLSKRRALGAKLRQTRRWLMLRGALLVLVVGAAGGWWFQRTGRWDATIDHAEAAWNNLVQVASNTLGLTVENVYLEGRMRMPLEEVHFALNIEEGYPILAADVDAMKARLEETGWVHAAHVKRALPDTLQITIEERQPMALWQWQGQLQLIDQQGLVITQENVGEFSHLPVVVGYNAPDYAYGLFSVLAEEPALFSQVASAIRVGDRRWNIRFYDGTEVMLPEAAPQEAWQSLAKLEREKSLLSREVTHIDLRYPGRVYIRSTPNSHPKQKEATST